MEIFGLANDLAIEVHLVAFGEKAQGKPAVAAAVWRVSGSPQPEEGRTLPQDGRQCDLAPRAIVKTRRRPAKIVAGVHFPLAGEAYLGGCGSSSKQQKECVFRTALLTVTTVVSSFWPHVLAALAIACADCVEIAAVLSNPKGSS